ncbi:MAG: ammonium transporter [Oscillospiraceae bacterium]|nr:ammonium transporter [Oscillospiraceae bacterium]
MQAAELLEQIDGEIFAVWFLIGAALVFFMQAGFAMVETGFTRAKNAANIIMKNLMDFCIGTPMFVLIGFGLFMGEDLVGLIGKPGFDVFTAYESFNWSNFVFNLVFCATAATIVSGAMAERTKFLSYCIYSGVISALVYPIEAHWIWGGGWLSQLGFHDFAGSCAIHMVGGIAALVGAKILGPRIGKFTKKSDGSIQPNAIPGHNLTLGALGCFILWFGWYGFNGAACTSTGQLASVFVTTTIAPAVATVTCMIFTWIKYGKPDVSMCLNASLAGLVGITAGCDVMDVAGSGIVGIVSGLLVCFGVWLLDYVLHIDDPVGAVAVHMMNGIWGTIAVGLFATTSVPGNDTMNGLFYGGGFSLLGKQLLGFVSVAAWTAIMMTIVFQIIKHTVGLRATEQEEILGMDAAEHGLVSSYADFAPAMGEAAMAGYPEHGEHVAAKPVPAAAERRQKDDASHPKMTKVAVVFNQEKLHHFIHAMERIGITGVTVTNVMGCGIQKSNTYYRGAKMSATLHPKIKAEIVVCKVPVETVIKTAREVLYTGQVGDGKIFTYPVEQVVKVRTGSVDYDALQNEELPETN